MNSRTDLLLMGGEDSKDGDEELRAGNLSFKSGGMTAVSATGCIGGFESGWEVVLREERTFRSCR